MIGWISHYRRLRLLLLAGVAVGTCGLAVGLSAGHVLSGIEDLSVDLRFKIRGSQRPPANFEIVRIDAASFQALNRQWPFPRALQAKVIGAIAAQHPAAIAVDVQFSESSAQGQNDDLALLAAIQAAHAAHVPTVFSTTETTRGGNFRFLGSTQGAKLLAEVGGRGANGLLPYDSDGTLRRIPLSTGGLPSLALATADLARHRTPQPQRGTRWIDFRGPTGTFPGTSFATVAQGHAPRHLFTHKIVVIGATAPSLQDLHPTPVDGNMPGPEIQAEAIDTALRGWPLSASPGWVGVLLTILMGLAVPLISLRLKPLISLLTGLAIAVAWLLLCQLAFDAGLVLSFVAPFLALALGAVGALAVQVLTETVERIRIHDLFARFVPENVVGEVLKSADGLRLGGVQREGTVMFTDLRGFTSLAETLTPAMVIDILNHYLTEMSDAILDHGGTLVAYMGDGIMAVYGAPLVQEDHADRALATAREMLGVRLPRFNDWLASQGLRRVEMGIGLNSGSVMSGHVGSERRVEYTAVGDTTNTAARIEALTKNFEEMLMFAESTVDALQQKPADLRFVTDTDIRGRTTKIRLWTAGDGRLQPTNGQAL